MTFRRRSGDVADREYEAARLYNDEVGSHLSLIASRRESINTRAGLLVASAAISSGFATVETPSGWLVTALVFTTISALIGIVALWPTKTDVVDIEVIREALLPDVSTETIISLGDSKIVLVPQASKRLEIRAFMVGAGFALLGIALIAAMCNSLNIAITIG
ncbi:MAG: hypothetical protein ACOH19_17530 [Rhodoglobus sp.]